MPLAAEKLPWSMTDWKAFEKHNETLIFFNAVALPSIDDPPSLIFLAKSSIPSFIKAKEALFRAIKI
jgi:hypothetical protein